ncbi:hypothetical protein HK103_005197 [Boothiomyces macroporosus]|uniref:mRNA decay factor PAT1 domain-containing protein n=1 Tax=Boothiomyces macroporosus TaxID=261099 RepID=A0AAD5UFI1_9FUNG|nr:hypothetical protein HK103_005197 [Boothiomyces macroporosus]
MSFFGFDTSKPADKEVIFEGEGSRYDELLESKFAVPIDQDKDRIIMDDDEELNDETFGDVGDITTDFDFGKGGSNQPPLQNQMNRMQHPGVPPMDYRQTYTQQKQVMPQSNAMSLEQVEAAMRAQSFQHRPMPPPMNQYPPQYMPMGHQRMPSQPIVIDGVQIAPIELDFNEKGMVFEILKQTEPLYHHIATLLKTLYDLRGELELENIKSLNTIRQTLKTQYELIGRRLFIIRPEQARNIHRSLINFFQYGEQLVKTSNAKSTERKQDAVESHAQPAPAQSKPPGEIQSVKPEREDPGKKVGPRGNKEIQKPIVIHQEEHEQEEERVVLDEADFPVLGAAKTEPKKGSKPQPERTNEDKPKDKKKQWKKIDDEELGFGIDDDPNEPREIKFSGLMRKFEKELIAKIQISQLVSENPFVDDYYFQMLTLKNSTEEQPNILQGKKKTWQKAHLANQLVGNSTGAAISNQMQQQMRRLIDSRKTKTKESTLSLEGALGKISTQSTRNPKRAFELATPIKSQTTKPMSQIKVLKYIEKVYDRIYAVEDIQRKKVEDDEDILLQHEQDIVNAKLELFKEMITTEEIPLNVPHPLVAALNTKKGVKATLRAFTHLNTKQILGYYSVLCKRFECLDASNTVLGKETKSVELFMNEIIPSFANVIADANLAALNTYMQIILERHNLIWLAKSKVGLVLLTMLLHRAENLKEAAASPASASGAPSENDLGMWEEIYNFIFESYKGQFPAIFSSSASAADEVYVWQFLSAMAVGASGIDHQRILVTELRYIHF